MEKLVAIVSRVPKGRLPYDDDIVDRLSHRFTSLILVVFAVTSTMFQYVGRPITCWVPKEFTGSHKKFTNSYCWVKNTYFLPLEDEIPGHLPAYDKPLDKTNAKEIIYYQWVPFIFLLQAFLFYAPSIVWHGLNSKSGVDADNILDAADRLQRMNKEGKRENTIRLIVNQFDRFLGRPRSGLESVNRIMQFFKKMLCGLCGKRLGNYLVILFIIVKLLYVGNVFLQLFVLNAILKTNYYIYGVEAIQNALNEQDWINSTVFPKVTMCDFDIRRMGNVQRYTVQCLLPINLYTEKMYIFLWFWLVLVLFLSLVSLLIWILRVACDVDKTRYVQSHLEAIQRLPDDKSREISRDFIYEYLKQDGVFLLRLIAHNTNPITVDDILAGIWDQWLERRPICIPPTVNSNGLQLQEKPQSSKGNLYDPLPSSDGPPIYKPTTHVQDV